MKIVYKNLGANSGERMMYIRSTDIERGRWDKLLLSFPDEALFFMTKGYKIVIEDKCSKKHGKVQRIFCPVMTDFLKVLCGMKPRTPRMKCSLLKALLAYKTNKIVFRKYRFFRDKLTAWHVRGRTVFCKYEPSVW